MQVLDAPLALKHKAFVQWLLFHRRAAEVTQQELADALRVSRTTVSSWETGRTYPALTLEQWDTFCQLLNCRIEEVPRPEDN